MAVTIAETSGHVTETVLKSPLSPPVTMRRNDRSHSPKYAPKGVTFGGGTKSDSFNGSAHDDVITTGGGLSNYVMAFAGDDMVVGGDGRDFIRTGQNASSPTLKDNDIGFGGARQGILDGRNISPARQAAMP